MQVRSCSFNPLTTKSFITCPSRDDYVVSQYCSVSTRLHFEYKDCLMSNGLVYFVTFTYNDRSVVNLFGLNLLNNSDIRFLFNKSRFPVFIKRHGYAFKFAIFGELGDGKGVRGLNNNPHYHALIYLYPLENCDYYYHNEIKFLELCKDSWNSEFNCSSKLYSALLRGNVSYSSSGALVQSERAFAYCASYCVKSLSDDNYRNQLSSILYKAAFVNLVDLVSKVDLNSSYARYLYKYDYSLSLFKRFVLSRRKTIPYFYNYNVKTDDVITFLKDYLNDCISKWLGKDFGLLNFDFSYIYGCPNLFETHFFNFLMKQELFVSFYKFLIFNHSVRYRLSSNLGSLGFKYITSEYKLDVSFFESFSRSSINLPSYYYRKLFFDIRNLDGKYIYVHNEKYNDYVSKTFTYDKFQADLCKFNLNRSRFAASLSDEQRVEFLAIPPKVFVSYKYFRGLSYCVHDVPLIDIDAPYLYLQSLDFTCHKLYFVPRDLSSFISDGFLSFSLHYLYINYSHLHEFSLMYDKFVNCSVSTSFVKQKEDYFELKNKLSYEIV